MKNNTKIFHKAKYTQKTATMNTISRHIKNINHMRNITKTAMTEITF